MPAEPHLADTNILPRLARRDDPEYSVVRAAIQKLHFSRYTGVIVIHPRQLVTAP